MIPWLDTPTHSFVSMCMRPDIRTMMGSLKLISFLSISLVSIVTGFPGIPPEAYSSNDLIEARDAAAQPICLPIPTVLKTSEDFVAKVHGICQRDEHSASPQSLGLVARQVVEDYSCDQNRPCRNGACCAKTGFCGFGPDSCGTNGESPNDKCWSNCDAHAE